MHPNRCALGLAAVALCATWALPAAAQPAGGTWTNTASMAVVRGEQTATILQDGRLLIVGGRDESVALSAAEIYDPGAGTWTSAGSMVTARYSHTATLLPDGRVLVSGGRNGNTFHASAEILDPGPGTWTTVASMAAARKGHSATLLPDGRVLVAGGYGGSYLSTAEIYNPGSSSWTSTGPLAIARGEHTATTLTDGRVLVACGFGGSYLASGEIYDPASGNWMATVSTASARYGHTSTRLPDGRVLVAGGYGGSYISTAEVYDPGSGNWTAAGAMTVVRYFHTATALADGRVLVAGGYPGGSSLSAEIYDPAGGTWLRTGSLASARGQHSAALLHDGRVLAAGGSGNAAYLSSAEIFDPSGVPPDMLFAGGPQGDGDRIYSEGDSDGVSAKFDVVLTASSNDPVTVSYATGAGGTAAANVDYQTRTGSLSFAPGQTHKRFAIAILPDAQEETDETFYVNLSSPSGATVDDGQARGTIKDNDPPPAGSPTVSVSDATVAEGDAGTANIAFTATLSGASSSTVTVPYATGTGGTATGGADFVAANGTLTFMPGQTSKTIAVAVRGDLIDEPNETFYVNLSSAAFAVLGDKQGRGTIVDQDP